MQNENRKLYPLRFTPQTEEFPWGKATYLVADLGYRDSMAENGWLGGNTLSELLTTYLERVVGDDNFEYYGLQFPVMLKELDVRSRMPLQVCPSDTDAEERYDAYGKKVLWYIEEAAPGAEICLGLKRNVSAAEFYSKCCDGTISEVLNLVSPTKGETYLINPGTVHYAGPGLKILEISESSELSFNLHNWEQSPETAELEEAFDLIDFNEYAAVPGPAPQEALSGLSASAPGSSPLAACKEFNATKIVLKDPIRIKSDLPGSFALYHCLSGEVSVQVVPEDGSAAGAPDLYALKKGSTVLVPSEINDFMLVPLKVGTSLVEVIVERRMYGQQSENQDAAKAGQES